MIDRWDLPPAVRVMSHDSDGGAVVLEKTTMPTVTMDAQENCVNHDKESHKISSSKSEHDSYPCLCSTRWSTTGMLFLTCTLMYVHRTNLSLAIVCMVKSDRPESHSASNISLSANDSVKYLVESQTNQSNFVDGSRYNLTESVQIKDKEADTGDTCAEAFADAEKEYERAELDWDKQSQSVLLSCYFFGNLATQIPSGRLSLRFGGKLVVLVAMAITMVCSLIIPVCARFSFYSVAVLRVLIGCCGGAIIPSVMTILTHWAPPFERGKMTASSVSGLMGGTVVSLFTSGFLCSYGFDNGWASIFYIHGIVTFLYLGMWMFCVFDYPEKHPRISHREKQYILQNVKINKTYKMHSPPWRRMLLSRAVLGLACTHFAFNWTFYTLLTYLPMFMKEVLKFNIRQNGVYSALPYLTMMCSMLISGNIADCLHSRGFLRLVTIRKIFQTGAALGPASCLIGAGFIRCDDRHIAVALICVATAFAGMASGGFSPNHFDFAGVFAGTVFGFSNTVATIPGIVAPIVAGNLTPNGTAEEWRKVFYVTAAVSVAGTVFYLAFAQATTQDWALVGIGPSEVEVALYVNKDLSKPDKKTDFDIGQNSMGKCVTNDKAGKEETLLDNGDVS